MRRLTKLLGFLAIIASAAALHADTAAPLAPTTSSPMNGGMSIADMQARASEMRSQWGEAYREVLAVREKARREKDVIKLNCVNEKLLLIKAQMNAGDVQYEDLQTSLANNTDGRFEQYALLSQSNESILQLRQDAKACVGELELYKQESGVIVTHPPFPDLPPEGGGFAPPGIEPPGYASPFR